MSTAPSVEELRDRILREAGKSLTMSAGNVGAIRTLRKEQLEWLLNGTGPAIPVGDHCSRPSQRGYLVTTLQGVGLSS